MEGVLVAFCFPCFLSKMTGCTERKGERETHEKMTVYHSYNVGENRNQLVSLTFHIVKSNYKLLKLLSHAASYPWHALFLYNSMVCCVLFLTYWTMANILYCRDVLARITGSLISFFFNEQICKLCFHKYME